MPDNEVPDNCVIFIIEDTATTAEDLRNRISTAIPSAKLEIIADFADGLKRIVTENPDIAVLDLFKGQPAQGDQAGKPIWEEIWAQRFMPVVIYSGLPDGLEPAVPQEHRFVKCLNKGSNGVPQVVEEVKSFLPHIAALRQTRNELQLGSQAALRDVSSRVWTDGLAPEKMKEVFLRCARRRLGAMMDIGVAGAETIEPWEQYIVPPVGNELLTGDILRLQGKPVEDCSAYRLVLSPSCDLFRRDGVIENVLTAKCAPYDRFVKTCGLKPETSAEKVQKQLTTALKEPHRGGCFLLPELPGVIPHLCACMKELELVPLKNVALPGHSTDTTYERVASIDSPFREHVAWAYMQISARPGLPDRNIVGWVKGIADIFTGTGGVAGT